MKYINAERLAAEIEIRLLDIRSPLIQTGLTMALDILDEAPEVDPVMTPEALSQIGKAYRQGYLDAALGCDRERKE